MDALIEDDAQLALVAYVEFVAEAAVTAAFAVVA